MTYLFSKLIMLSMTLLPLAAASAVELRVTPFVVEAEGAADISVLLDSDADYTGFQTQIVLPEGLTFANGDKGYLKLPEDLSLSHQITSNLVGDTMKVVCFSAENDFFPRNGKLFSFSVKGTQGFNQGEIKLINTIFSDIANQDVSIPESRAEGRSVLITRSPETVIIKHGDRTTLEVKAKGGFSEGIAYEWTHAGERVGTDSSLSVTGHAEGGDPECAEYNVRVTDTHEGAMLFERIYSFDVESWPPPDTETETAVSRDKIRENDTVTLSAIAPSGGYTDWRWGWYMDGSAVSDDLQYSEVLLMEPGFSKQTDVHSFTFRAINYGPDGDIWGEPAGTEHNVTVYRRPHTPESLSYIRDGGIYRLAIETGVPEEDVRANGYSFTLGYESEEGDFRIVYCGQSTTCDLESAYYGDVIDNLWCYATWTYDDDSMVSSGRRHINGMVEEDFDASVFSDPSGTLTFTEETVALSTYLEGRTIRVINPQAAGIQTRLYNLNGELLICQSAMQGSGVCMSLENLLPGVYLLKVSTADKVITRKFLLN